MFASQLSGHCDVIANRLWRHQQNIKRASETRDDVWRSSFLSSFMDSLCRVRNRIMYVLLWRTVYALTRVLFWCLFPSLLRNSGYKHQNNPLVSTFLTCQALNLSPIIKSISNELDIAIHVIASQLSGHCDVIGNRLWRHQQNENWVSETRERCVKIVVLSLFIDSFCRVRNKIMYIL